MANAGKSEQCKRRRLGDERQIELGRGALGLRVGVCSAGGTSGANLREGRQDGSARRGVAFQRLANILVVAGERDPFTRLGLEPREGFGAQASLE